ncbi:MAG: putative pterin-4-alpha-carbinolamine dehydratase [Fimbriimonadaceae bacterium]|nr:putative pterin-4-alpha-carbinolamine dehydratase [Fimbriimonadaceae bacterium]
MSTLSRTKLTDDELSKELATLESWTIEDGMLTRSYKCRNYVAGLDFAKAIGMVAEGLDHHPDMLIGYGTVKIMVVTHSAGGLTPYDIELAKRINAIDYATGFLA